MTFIQPLGSDFVSFPSSRDFRMAPTLRILVGVFNHAPRGCEVS